MNESFRGLIIKKEDGSEKVNYNNDDFPSYIHAGWVEPYCSWINIPHFHEDLEFVTITRGEMGYNINGKKIILHQGDTLMVNLYLEALGLVSASLMFLGAALTSFSSSM